MRAFDDTILFPIIELGISQLYLNEDKILGVTSWFCPEALEQYAPLPVHDFGNGRYTLTDGHSRAYVAYKHGLTHIPIIYDQDDLVTNPVGQLSYQTDIAWCNRFGLQNILQLGQRIVSSEDYQRLWIERCDRSYNLLTHTTESERKRIERCNEGFFLYGASEDLCIFYFEDASGKLYQLKNGVLVPE